MQKVLVISGPNLNMLGTRQPEIYGSTTLADIEDELKAVGAELGFDVECKSSNDEADLVQWIQSAALNEIPVVINPAAFTHYSYSLRDACAARKAPIIEVHISNPHAREEFRSKSVISAVVTGTITGFGKNSYRLALVALKDLLK